MKKFVNAMVMCAALLMLFACSDDDDFVGSTAANSQPVTVKPAVELRSGIFVDSPVQGLAFVSGNTQGITNAQGDFIYEFGASVAFSIGGIELGTAGGAEIITPVDMVAGATDETHPVVVNLIRFLQTLDDDGNPANGIVITESVRNLASDRSINFSQSIAAFESDGIVQTAVAELTAVTAAGARTLIPASQAQAHLGGTLLAFFAGSYSGAFTGGASGTFDLVIDASGNISGTGVDADGSFSIAGSVTSDGAAAAGNVTTGATFAMTISRAGDLAGTWSNTIYGISGTLSGNRN